MNADEGFDLLLKVIVIGDSNVGKSNIMGRYTNDTFSEESKPTIGVSFATRGCKVKAGGSEKRVKLQIWDTAGQERYRALTGVYYRGAVGALVVYDITDKQSFLNVPKWLAEIEKFCDSDPVVMLVGNKVDLVDERCVMREESQEFAEEKSLHFMETSALADTNVDSAFEYLAKSMVDRTSSVAGSKEALDKEGVDIIIPTDAEEEKQPEQAGCSC